MNTLNDGGPAFPVTLSFRQSDGQPMTAADFMVGGNGMTLRDYFAAAALQGISAVEDKRTCDSVNWKKIEEWRAKCRKDDAEWCYAMADTMLAAREKGEHSE